VVSLACIFPSTSGNADKAGSRIAAARAGRWGPMATGTVREALSGRLLLPPFAWGRGSPNGLRSVVFSRLGLPPLASGKSTSTRYTRYREEGGEAVRQSRQFVSGISLHRRERPRRGA